MLAIWGLVDRRLSRESRIALALTPVAYALLWGGLTAWAATTDHVFYGQSRISGMQDFSSSRLGIWSNTLSLIASHPWFGVGWGGKVHEGQFGSGGHGPRRMCRRRRVRNRPALAARRRAPRALAGAGGGRVRP